MRDLYSSMSWRLITPIVCYGIALTASQFAENERRIGYFRTALFYTDTILVGAGLSVDAPGWASDSRLLSFSNLCSLSRPSLIWWPHTKSFIKSCNFAVPIPGICRRIRRTSPRMRSCSKHFLSRRLAAAYQACLDNPIGPPTRQFSQLFHTRERVATGQLFGCLVPDFFRIGILNCSSAICMAVSNASALSRRNRFSFSVSKSLCSRAFR